VEGSLHHLTLFNSKLRVKKEIITQEIGHAGKDQSSSSVERQLEKDIKKREEEYQRIRNDIERVQSYQPAEAKEGTNDLSKDLRTVKAFIREAVEGNLN
jgi:archaellum component FlaC